MNELLDKYLQIKRETEQAQREADKTTGALQQMMQQLEKTFGCKTIKQAKKLYRKKVKEKDRLEQVAANAMNDFESKWHKEIDE